MGTLSESVCDNVWESKADTLCRPACAQTLVLVNPFSKAGYVLEIKLRYEKCQRGVSSPSTPIYFFQQEIPSALAKRLSEFSRSLESLKSVGRRDNF